MWILLVLTAAFFNALWTAISKKSLITLSPFSFTFLFRSLTTILLLPWLLFNFQIPTNPAFWKYTIAAGFLEVTRITVLSTGIKEDYYSTFAFYNTSPIFTIMVAPAILPEKVNIALLGGVVFMVSGALMFYRLGRFSHHGLFCALTSCFTGICSKIAIGYSSAYAFMFFSFFIGICSMGIYGLVFKRFDAKNISFKEGSLLSGIAFLSMIATVCYYLAISLAPITRVNPLVRTNLLFGFIFSYFLLKETDQWKRKLSAGMFILLGALFIGLS